MGVARRLASGAYDPIDSLPLSNNRKASLASKPGPMLGLIPPGHPITLNVSGIESSGAGIDVAADDHLRDVMKGRREFL